MSEENVEFVRRALPWFGGPPAGVVEAARAGHIAPDAEFDFSAVYPDGPIIRGIEDWRRYVESLPWGGSLRLEAERFFDVDHERVLVFMRVTAAGKESGALVEMRTAHEFTIRDGVLVKWKAYADRSDALEAVGLRQSRRH
jgi:ketosteroid isomerase-like protein